MKRTITWTAAAFAAGVLTACSADGAILPRTAANVTACRVLAQVVAGQEPPQALVGAVIETNAPITHQLRQDLAQYGIDAAQPGDTDTGQAKAVAVQDCRAIGAG
jgi:hypothetical protein